MPTIYELHHYAIVSMLLLLKLGDNLQFRFLMQNLKLNQYTFQVISRQQRSIYQHECDLFQYNMNHCYRLFELS
ncbi:hypothetical protein QQG55_43055 [Brugia pahangi]